MTENNFLYTTDLAFIRKNQPLVHLITNFVTMDFIANSLLAIGASPIMAHAREEMPEMVSLSGALVINIGTLEEKWIQSMHVAIKKAMQKNKPIILDPVGAGATSFRTRCAREILERFTVTALRGNASEIASLLDADITTKGVDSLLSSNDAIASAKQLAKKYNITVAMTGKIDYVTNGEDIIDIHGGHDMMRAVTGMGCTATALIGAFLAVCPSHPLEASHAALTCMKRASEEAATKSKGPASFKVAFIDALYSL